MIKLSHIFQHLPRLSLEYIKIELEKFNSENFLMNTEQRVMQTQDKKSLEMKLLCRAHVNRIYRSLQWINQRCLSAEVENICGWVCYEASPPSVTQSLDR